MFYVLILRHRKLVKVISSEEDCRRKKETFTRLYGLEPQYFYKKL